MEKKLRKKFIFFSVGVVFIVLILIAGCVNLINLSQLNYRSEAVSEILVENDGEFPKMKNNGDTDFLKDRLSPEMAFSNRFFTVKTDVEKNVITVNTGDVYLTSATEAVEYAKNVLKTGNQTGFLNGFKYTVSEKDYGILIVFVDVSRDFSVFYSTLRNSFLVSAIVLVAVAVLSLILSKKAVSPMVLAYEKQKRFITDASHELKTPLAIINTSADVLEMEKGTSKWTDNIHKQVIRLNELIGNLITLTKLEEEQKIEKKEFSFSDIIKEIFYEYELIMSNSNKKIVGDIDEGINFVGDEKLIRQFITILLDNSMKYAKENSTVNISLKKQNRKIVFSVENEADGLEVKNYDVLFERFYRSDNSRNSKTGGYGIGLSVAKTIVLQHKGKISAESSDGKSIIFKAKF